VTTSYLLDLAGNQVTELNASGGWKHTNLFLGGRLLATYEGPYGTASAGYHFHLTDWLGTQRMQTTASGIQEETCTNYPFGDGLSCIGSADATEHHFTGKERDAESGLDYFFARYLNSNLGRFMTPDWAAAPTAVPYATFGDPQTLNLYAYVNNNPNTGIDIGGHWGTDQQTAEMAQEAADAAGKQALLGEDRGGGSNLGTPSGSGSGNGTDKTPPKPPDPKPPVPAPKHDPKPDAKPVPVPVPAVIAPRASPQFNANQGAVTQPGAETPPPTLKPAPVRGVEEEKSALQKAVELLQNVIENFSDGALRDFIPPVFIPPSVQEKLKKTPPIV
jgi:RHS repeat-associated protein